ncbi:MAG: FAA hydrolase family protein [Bacteroidetes bacterium]|nr:MAG: FAA hydrolase family protein [Bacteroidota bacterium]
MKILAIGRNYVAHIQELQNEIPDEPVIFLKPDTAILRNNEPFYMPSFSQDIHHEVELVLRVCKEGKFIAPEFAHKYFDAIGLGIDFTARDIQNKAKAKGLPWETAKGFNGSAPISTNFIPVNEFSNLNNIGFHLEINGETRQTGNTSLVLFDFYQIIHHLSKYFTLKTGDLIFTGTPAGVSAVKVGDRLKGFIENKEMFDFEVK